ncbi:Isotrichodermin C-15 hydroxylase, partial [Colletotrichum tanaceti]
SRGNVIDKRSVIKAYPLGGLLFDLFAPRGYLQDSGKHMQHCSDLVAKRLDKGDDGRPDIFGHVLKQPGGSMPLPLMNANANMLMVAGTETTATTLTTATHLLLRNPDKMQKLIREIRAVPDRAMLNSQTVQRMKYLNAVLEEALRFYPSGQVGLGTQREIAPGGNQICDDFLAEGTEVAVAAWTMSNSPLHWKDPAAFVPERWLLEETGFSAYHEYDNRAAWLAFGTGPRTCIGKNIAMHEIRGVLARFLYDFDLASTPETADWLHIKTHSIWAKPKLMARVTRAR